VFRKVMPTELVEQLCGGVAIKLWERLHNWADDRRVATGQATWMEWFQWLVERFMERGRDTATPAWQLHRAPLR
ncbi:MAG TPA: hypothetical protein VM100_01955, partial [Longimicrobiales bacterium]|nr:hypothetical protein [Longimicrobiales bacterium]